MNLVNQTTFGGKDASVENQGNCFQACLATVLQMPIEEVFDIRPYPIAEWVDRLNEWLLDFNLACVFVKTTMDDPAPITGYPGLCIAQLTDGKDYHAVVIQDEDIIHDPMPDREMKGGCDGIYLFVSVKPYRNVRVGSLV